MQVDSSAPDAERGNDEVILVLAEKSVHPGVQYRFREPEKLSYSYVNECRAGEADTHLCDLRLTRV
jgi:hypothetical protein